MQSVGWLGQAAFGHFMGLYSHFFEILKMAHFGVAFGTPFGPIQLVNRFDPVPD